MQNTCSKHVCLSALLATL